MCFTRNESYEMKRKSKGKIVEKNHRPSIKFHLPEWRFKIGMNFTLVSHILPQRP